MDDYTLLKTELKRIAHLRASFSPYDLFANDTLSIQDAELSTIAYRRAVRDHPRLLHCLEIVEWELTWVALRTSSNSKQSNIGVLVRGCNLGRSIGDTRHCKYHIALRHK